MNPETCAHPAVSRRSLLIAPATLAFASGACAQDGGTAFPGNGRTLVVYLSRSGNTRVIAGTLQRILKADLFEIRAARPYPKDYEEHVAQATRERDVGYEPPLVGRIENIDAYAQLFLGFPVWGGTAPPPIRSFLRGHDLRGRTLRPFITHGGYGIGDCSDVLASHAPGARIASPFVMEADQERRTLTQVRGWLGNAQV